MCTALKGNEIQKPIDLIKFIIELNLSEELARSFTVYTFPVARPLDRVQVLRVFNVAFALRVV